MPEGAARAPKQLRAQMNYRQIQNPAYDLPAYSVGVGGKIDEPDYLTLY